jgi:hypothetical protein
MSYFCLPILRQKNKSDNISAHFSRPRILTFPNHQIDILETWEEPARELFAPVSEAVVVMPVTSRYAKVSIIVTIHAPTRGAKHITAWCYTDLTNHKKK